MTAVGSVLVANRGEIARRVFRTCRGMGMRSVAVFVDADEGAPFVVEADEAIRVPDGGYLDGAAVIAAAQMAGADAVHPGYGFLSENAGFARAVTDAGLTWIGPSPDVIESMGDKIAAKAAASAADVPTLPSTTDPSEADAIGYPLLVKASAGGGGKGMRIVESAADLDESVASAQREAAGAFGDERVFLERYVPRSRHIEIQILGDRHGDLSHLGERECSIQRRHQKVIEEAPSPFVTAEMRAAMGDAALRLGRAMGYESAGTVEFLVDDETGDYFFLEVNTRLQVEHPVTEAVTGVDLVRAQLLIAQGEPLGVAAGIGGDTAGVECPSTGAGSVDEATGADDMVGPDVVEGSNGSGSSTVSIHGHAVEARLYAEDPAAGFLPATGTLAAFEPGDEPRVRWDSGVEAGSVVGVDFDPMLAKVIAHGPTRAEAAGRLARALERLHLGGVTTNRDFLVATLRHEDFLAGSTTTDFIDRLGGALTGMPRASEAVPEPAAVSSDAPADPAPEDESDPEAGQGAGAEPRVDPGSTQAQGAATTLDATSERAVATAALWLHESNRRDALVLGSVPGSWRNARLPRERVEFVIGDAGVTVAYGARRGGAFDLSVEGGTDRHAVVHRWSSTDIDVELDGHRRTARVTRADGEVHVQTATGTVTLGVTPRFTVPGSDGASGGLTAPMPGVVLDVRVSAGDAVESGQVLVVLEAMKMEHHIKAPTAGTVTEVRVEAGAQVENGAVLMVIDDAGEQ